MKIRCLVIQLARLGDTLQSLMALRAAKQLYPDLEIHFVARETFADAAKRVPWLSGVYTLPTDRLLAPLLAGTKTEQQMLPELARWLTPLVQEPWDFAVNWSYSESSSWLTALVPARVKLGYSRREDGTLSVVDGWSHYVQAVVQGTGPQNIHVTDILTTQLLTALQIHVGDPADAGNDTVTSKSFFNLEMGSDRVTHRFPDLRDHARKWIGIQLGAGTEAKSWDPENWAGVAAQIIRRHPDCGIVLMGGKADLARRDRFFAALAASDVSDDRVVSLVGDTSFDAWAGVVGRCQWLLAADTAVIHLASILGTRVLNVSLGPVRWRETGPYGNGHYIVAPTLECEGCKKSEASASSHSCRTDVTSEAVYGAWAYASSEWSHRRQSSIETHFSRLGWTRKLDGVTVLRARIRSTNDGGGVVYESLASASIDFNEWSAQATGTIARAWYCGWLPPIGHEISREMISPKLIGSLRPLDESLQVLRKICEEASRTAKQLQRRAMAVKSERLMSVGDRSDLADLARKLQDLDELVERMSITHAALAPFGAMLKVLMHNLNGEQLAELGRESAQAYDQLRQGVDILSDWVKHTLKLARPVAVASRPIETAKELSQ